MIVSENTSLKKYNTFGIDVSARYFGVFDTVEKLASFFEFASDKNLREPLILGGGSNLLFTGNIQGIVLHNCIPGIEVLKESDDSVMLSVGAGENWHALVMHCVNRGWGGIENLSLIPGNVGASPMQNIGAYGVEVKESIVSVEAWDIHNRKIVVFSNSDCAFAYRESIFKKKHKGDYVILNVVFRLLKKPVFRMEYGAIREELEKGGIEPSIKAISDAVIRIRQSKLPDPKQIGNAGSFFKNPGINSDHYEILKQKFPEMVAYKNPDGTYKVAAGWLIEQCGWKGYRRGDAGCHARQALVLVNYGHATGMEILSLSEDILQSVFDKFGILLEREVNLFPESVH